MIHQCEKCDGEFEDLKEYINHFPACNRKHKNPDNGTVLCGERSEGRTSTLL